MEAFRVIQIPQSGKITITLPVHLKNKAKLEVIILTVDDTEIEPFDPKKFKGQLKLNLSTEEIATLCQEMREEWNRVS